jgi:DNA invertase Pin-like site-specific DNA recombinase
LPTRGAFKVVDDPTIDTISRTGKLIVGILALIAEFKNDIRHERQMDGIKKARESGVRFGRKPLLISETIKKVKHGLLPQRILAPPVFTGWLPASRRRGT